MKIREANLSDSNDIYKWRNDPLTRQMSFNSDVVSFVTHNEWFKNSLKNKNRFLLVAEFREKKISVVRFDIKEEKFTAEININLNPLERGKGLSSTVISKSILYFNKKNNEKVKIIVSKIKKENAISKRSFLKCGFKLDLVEKNIEIYNFYC